MRSKIPGNTKTCYQSSGSTPALKRVKPGFEPTSLIPGGHPNIRGFLMEQRAQLLTLAYLLRKHKINIVTGLFQENSNHKLLAQILSYITQVD